MMVPIPERYGGSGPGASGRLACSRQSSTASPYTGARRSASIGT